MLVLPSSALPWVGSLLGCCIFIDGSYFYKNHHLTVQAHSAQSLMENWILWLHDSAFTHAVSSSCARGMFLMLYACCFVLEKKAISCHIPEQTHFLHSPRERHNECKLSKHGTWLSSHQAIKVQRYHSRRHRWHKKNIWTLCMWHLPSVSAEQCQWHALWAVN